MKEIVGVNEELIDHSFISLIERIREDAKRGDEEAKRVLELYEKNKEEFKYFVNLFAIQLGELFIRRPKVVTLLVEDQKGKLREKEFPEYG